MAQSDRETPRLSAQELDKQVMHDTLVDIKAKEHVIGHDWADHSGAYTAEELAEIHAFKRGWLCALTHTPDK